MGTYLYLRASADSRCYSGVPTTYVALFTSLGEFLRLFFLGCKLGLVHLPFLILLFVRHANWDRLVGTAQHLAELKVAAG